MMTDVKLMVVFSKLAYYFTESLGKNLEELGMPYSQYPILAHLNEVDRAKTQSLGTAAVITSGTITHTVNKLIKEGLVRKVQDEEDKRIYWVEITPKGRAKFKRVDDEHMKYLHGVLEDFTEEEKLAFIEQIKYFGKAIEQKVKGD